MIANQLVLTIMIAIVIINTANGKCLEVEQKYPVITVLNTSVNAIPGKKYTQQSFCMPITLEYLFFQISTCYLKYFALIR